MSWEKKGWPSGKRGLFEWTGSETQKETGWDKGVSEEDGKIKLKEPLSKKWQVCSDVAQLMIEAATRKIDKYQKRLSSVREQQKSVENAHVNVLTLVCVEWGETGEKLSWNEGRGWTEGGTFINIYVLILNTLCKFFPVFNARSCFNVFFKLLDDTWVNKVIIVIVIIIIIIIIGRSLKVTGKDAVGQTSQKQAKKWAFLEQNPHCIGILILQNLKVKITN